MHMYVSKQTITGSGNGSSPGRYQTIIWSIAVILLIGPSITNFSDILFEIHLRKCIWKCRLEYGGNFVSASMW